MVEITGTPAQIYEQHVVPAIVGRWAPDLVEVLSVRPGERVLDLACGTGVVTRLLPDRVGPAGRVVGVDLWGEGLTVARGAAADGQVEWLQADAEEIPIRDATFDAVVCQQGLQFVPDKRAAVREMRRVLVAGGRLVLSVWCSVVHAPGWRIVEEALAKRLGAQRAVHSPFTLPPGSGEATPRAAATWETLLLKHQTVWLPARRDHGRAAGPGRCHPSDVQPTAEKQAGCSRLHRGRHDYLHAAVASRDHPGAGEGHQHDAVVDPGVADGDVERGGRRPAGLRRQPRRGRPCRDGPVTGDDDSTGRDGGRSRGTGTGSGR